MYEAMFGRTGQAEDKEELKEKLEEKLEVKERDETT